jgi:uncharacterized GH25 family protein
MTPAKFQTLNSPTSGYKQPTIVGVHAPTTLDATPIAGRKAQINVNISEDAFARQKKSKFVNLGPQNR